MSLALSPSSSAPSLLPLSLEASLGLESLTRPLSPAPDCQQPPPKLSLIRRSSSPEPLELSPRQPSSGDEQMLVVGHKLHSSANRMSTHQKPTPHGLVPNHQKPNQLSANQILALQQPYHPLSQLSTNQLSPNQTLANQAQAEQAQAQLLLLQQQGHGRQPNILSTAHGTHMLTHTFAHSHFAQASMMAQHSAHQSPLSMPAAHGHTHMHALVHSPTAFPPAAVCGGGVAELAGVHVKEEQSSPLSRPSASTSGGEGEGKDDDLENEETPMDTHAAPSPSRSPCPNEDSHPHAQQQAVESELSFDSAFPELSELITAEASGVGGDGGGGAGSGRGVSSGGVLGLSAGSGPEMFPERYVVPPQPSPSSAFIPFPAHAATVGPGADGHGRPANITDFSPEWSYPEVSPNSSCFHT